MGSKEEVALEIKNGNNELCEIVPKVLNDAFKFVKSGHKRTLFKYLSNNENYDPFETDENGKTVLHHAVTYTSRVLAHEMVAMILRCDQLWRDNYIDEDKIKELVDVQDINHETALHLAAKKGRKKIVEQLLDAEASLNIRDKQNKTPLDHIYVKVPEVIVTRYNTCVRFKKEQDKVNDEQLRLDFNAIIGQNCDNAASEESEKKETEILAHLLQASAEKFAPVLQHPLVQAYLYLKYEKAYFVIMASIAVHIFWYAVYAYFIFSIYFQSCPWRRNEENGTTLNGTMSKIACPGEELNFPGLPLAIVSWTLALLFLVKEMFEICTVPPSRYFAQLENIGQLLVIVSVIWTPWPIYEYLGGKDIIMINPWQYELAAVSVFAVWALVLSQLGKIQRLRLYLEIFVKVFKSFMFFLISFGSLLIAFAFSFCIIMPEAKSFETPLLAIPKVLVMMTGELNYDDLFYNKDDAGSNPIYFTTTQFIFVLFTILISIILINLLIGLTVSDTQELISKGHVAELSSMLEAIYLAESLAERISQLSSTIHLSKFYSSDWLLDRLSISKTTVYNFCCIRNKTWKEIQLHDNDFGIVELSFSNKYPFPESVMLELKHLAEDNLYSEEKETLTTNAELLRQLEKMPTEFEKILTTLNHRISSTN